jgi:hypothetical protein
MASRREPVSNEEIRKLICTCESDLSVLGLRDAALTYLVAVMGISESVLTECHLNDVRIGRIFLRTHDLEISLPSSGERLVQKWIDARGIVPGPLFLPIGRANRPLPRPLCRATITAALARRCEEAGIPAFSGNDILQTRAARLHGYWGRERTVDPPIYPILDAAVEPEVGAIRYLRRLTAAKRRRAVALLDSFAHLLKPGASALTTRWCEISEVDFLRAARCTAASHSIRALNAIRQAVNTILQQEFVSGRLSSERYQVFLAAPWGRQEVSPRASIRSRRVHLGRSAMVRPA